MRDTKEPIEKKELLSEYAERYLAACEEYTHFLSYVTLLRLLRSTDLRIQFETHSDSFVKRAIKVILATLGIHHSAFLRTVMVILEKPLPHA